MHLDEFWTFGRAEYFPKVQKPLPFPEPFVAKTLEKRSIKRARLSAAAADFWTVLAGAPRRAERSKTPPPEGMAKNGALTTRSSRIPQASLPPYRPWSGDANSPQ